MGVCGIFRPPVQGGSIELISKFLSSMILYNHPSHFKSGEINSCRLSPLPTMRPNNSLPRDTQTTKEIHLNIGKTSKDNNQTSKTSIIQAMQMARLF